MGNARGSSRATDPPTLPRLQQPLLPHALTDDTISPPSPSFPTHHVGASFHSRLPFKLNVKRVGLSLGEQFSDVFQSMLDAPFHKFLLLFFLVYVYVVSLMI